MKKQHRYDDHDRLIGDDADAGNSVGTAPFPNNLWNEIAITMILNSIAWYLVMHYLLGA